MLRAPISGTKRLWFDLSIAGAPTKRINLALFDNAYPKTAEKLLAEFETRSAVGPVKGLIQNEFVLMGNKMDTRNKIGIEDKSLYTMDVDDLEKSVFTVGHRHRGLLSLGQYQAGSEFGICLNECAYFDHDIDNQAPTQPRSIVGLVENIDQLDMFYEVPHDDLTGVPSILTEIVNCGVNSDHLTTTELENMNRQLIKWQLEDVRAKDQLFWKLITGCYSHVNLKDLFYAMSTYGLVAIVLFKTYIYVKTSNLRPVVYSHSEYLQLQKEALNKENI